MSIIRTQKNAQTRSVRLQTKALHDPRVSFLAKGLYAYLMSRPNGAHVSIDQLAHHSQREDQETIRRAVQELFDAGYLIAEDGLP